MSFFTFTCNGPPLYCLILAQSTDGFCFRSDCGFSASTVKKSGTEVLHGEEKTTTAGYCCSKSFHMLFNHWVYIVFNRTQWIPVLANALNAHFLDD